MAKILMPTSRCDPTVRPFAWQRANEDLPALVGTSRELFTQTEGATRYLGTFRCVSVGTSTPDQLLEWPKEVSQVH